LLWIGVRLFSKPKDILMKIDPVDYIPISKAPSNIFKKDQTVTLYVDEKELKKVKNESGCAESFSMAEFRRSGFKPSINYNPLNIDNYLKPFVAGNYDDHNINRGIKTFPGMIVDTLI